MKGAEKKEAIKGATETSPDLCRVLKDGREVICSCRGDVRTVTDCLLGTVEGSIEDLARSAGVESPVTRHLWRLLGDERGGHENLIPTYRGLMLRRQGCAIEGMVNLSKKTSF